MIIIINFSNSVLYSKRNSSSDNRMINYTNVAAATAFHIPKLGLGTLSISSAEVKPVINEALSLGYRLFDTAPGKFIVFK